MPHRFKRVSLFASRSPAAGAQGVMSRRVGAGGGPAGSPIVLAELLAVLDRGPRLPRHPRVALASLTTAGGGLAWRARNSCQVVEKRAALDDTPRASTNPRTLELFRGIGLGPALERVGWDGPPPLVNVASMSRVDDTADIGDPRQRGRRRADPPREYTRRLDTISPVSPVPSRAMWCPVPPRSMCTHPEHLAANYTQVARSPERRAVP
jgi:hypothetical protein